MPPLKAPHPTPPLPPDPVIFTCSMEFYLTAAHLSTGVSMGAEAETLILCRVAMDCPRESLHLVVQCLREIYHTRPGEKKAGARAGVDGNLESVGRPLELMGLLAPAFFIFWLRHAV